MDYNARDAKIQDVIDFDNIETSEEEIFKYLYGILSDIGLQDNTYILFDDETLTMNAYKTLPMGLIMNDDSDYSCVFKPKPGSTAVHIANIEKSYYLSIFDVNLQNLMKYTETMVKLLRKGVFTSDIITNDKHYYRSTHLYYDINIDKSSIKSFVSLKPGLRASVIKLDFKYTFSFKEEEPLVTIERFRIESQESDEINYVYVPTDYELAE
jgi:hypothetical protein